MVGTTVEAGLPNITGYAKYTDDNGDIASVSGAFYNKDITRANGSNLDTTPDTSSKALGFDASLSSSIYGKSITVQPTAVCMYLEFYIN